MVRVNSKRVAIFPLHKNNEVVDFDSFDLKYVDSKKKRKSSLVIGRKRAKNLENLEDICCTTIVTLS